MLTQASLIGINELSVTATRRQMVPGRPFKHSLMFVGKARGLSQSGAPEKCFKQVGTGVARKHQTRRTQTSEQAAKACQGQTLAYYEIMEVKSITTLDPSILDQHG